jgi:hypothetical protein
MAGIIDKYRSTQRRIRRILGPYTAALCPDCPEPCCRKPAKVREFDVLLANACGCSLPSANDAVSEMVEAGIEVLTGVRVEPEPEPCHYLGPGGCLFPDDLRPFECTRWICSRLKKEISPGDMRSLRNLLHKLGVLHRELEESVGLRR